MTLDDYIERRNGIQLRFEDTDKANLVWENLGVATRHIDRICQEILSLTPAVEKEIKDCLDRVEKEFPLCPITN